MDEALVEYIRYDRWATRTTLDACRALEDEELRRDLKTSHTSIWGTLAHIYQADCVWWNRIGGASITAADPGASLEQLRERWLDVLDRFVAWAETRTAGQWCADLEYRNSQGREFRQPLGQIALHVVNHATLHRGQVLSMFRQLGRVPTGVDLIFYYRGNEQAPAQTKR